MNPKFDLPKPPKERAGGTFAPAFLQVLFHDQHAADPMSSLEFINRMKSKMDEIIGDNRVLKITSNRMIHVNKTFEIVPKVAKCKRAILIGINYTGQSGELSDCHKNVGNIKTFLEDVHGFKERDILVLLDNSTSFSPTHQNILDAFTRICHVSSKGDVAFVYYSGHGGRVRDKTGTSW